MNQKTSTPKTVLTQGQYAIQTWHHKDDPQKTVHYQVVEKYRCNNKRCINLLREGETGALSLAMCLNMIINRATQDAWIKIGQNGNWTVKNFVRKHSQLTQQITKEVITKAEPILKTT